MDLNCDLGEGFDEDEALFAIVSSANIACGGHAGDEATMLASCRMARESGVRVGAHPSYPDRAGFGRRPVEIGGDELAAEVFAQIAALDRAAEAAGTAVSYVKPHGALYNRIAVDPVQAAAVAAAVARRGLVLLGPPSSAIEQAAHDAGVRFRREAFVDRGYRSDGSLVPRGESGAVIPDARSAAERAVALATTGRIRAADGAELIIGADSLCIHGDTAGATRIAIAVRSALEQAGVRVEAFT